MTARRAHPQRGGKSPVPEDQTRSSQWWLRAALITVTAIALGSGAFAGWRWLRFPQRVQAALPVAPDLDARPKVLRDAIAVAQSMIVTRGRALEGVAELGRLYHANGFMPEAEACWRLLQAGQPHEGRWVYYRADARRAASDYPAVQSLLRETVARAPDYAPAWLQLAALEFKSGAFDAAEADYHRRLALVPGDPYAQLDLARIALQRGGRDAARQLLEQLVKDSPDFPPGQNLLAEILAAEGNPARAREHRWLGREAGRFKEPVDPWLTELQAWCHDANRLSVAATMEYQTGRNDRARALLERAFALAPEEPEIRTLLGELYLKTGDAVRARATLEPLTRDSARTAAKPPLGLYLTLSDAQRALGATAEALAALDAGLVAFPEAADLYKQRGVVLEAAGRSAEARMAFNEALTRNPGDADAAFYLGVSLLGAGAHDDAQRSLKRALAVQPTHPQALTLLARIELEAERLDAAWTYLEPLYENNSGLPQVRQLVARWYGRAGNAALARRESSRAERYFRDGIAVSPADAELQASLGVLYLTLGRFIEALPPLEAYHRLQPDDARSALFLGQVYASVGRIEEARRVLAMGEQVALRAGQTATANHCREILRQL